MDGENYTENQRFRTFDVMSRDCVRNGKLIYLISLLNMLVFVECSNFKAKRSCKKECFLDDTHTTLVNVID